MDGLQTRLRPAGTGREVAKQIELTQQLYRTRERTARAGYHGAALPPTSPTPRNPIAIARDLRAASGHLADLAELIGAESFDAQTLTNADALLVGASRLICELRARGVA